uniref:Uncharacterized protein n=1 Tax=Burkholderia sp. (strain CCGE1003) TaxID=640512 RepID=E1TJ78_BURSG
MSRFHTLAYDPGQTRNVLRSRFRRNLPSRVFMSAPRQNPPEYKDEDVLAALLVADMQHNDELETFRRHYEEVRLNDDVGLPTFEDAISRGWFRIVWGRVRSSRLLLDFLRHRQPPYDSTLIGLLMWRYKAHVHVSKTSLGAEHEALVEFLTSEEGTRGIDTLSPQWIAARLWDRDPTVDIKIWARRWGFLGSPIFSASKAWDGVADSAQRFYEAAISALSDAGLVTWDEFNTAGEAVFLETGSMSWTTIRTADVSSNHLLGKYLRLQRHSRGYFRDIDDDEDLLALVDLLCVDGVEQFPAREPHVNILAVVKLAQRHPSVLMQLTLHVRRHPELLAELLLLPETTLLACYLVATWDEFGSGEREAMQELDRATRAIAFDDCMAVLAHVSRGGEVSAVELSELLTLLVGMSLRSNEEARYAENLSLQICALTPEQQEDVLRQLAGRAGQSVDDSDFVALLSLLSTVRIDVARQVAGDVARVYLRYMQNEDGFFEPTHITRAHAHVLWELVLGLPEEIVSRTLNPIDVKDLLTNLEGDEKERRIIHLCRAMRAHMRLLARGISSYQGTAPRELIEALARAIRSGAQRHDEKGRLPAFSRFYDVTFSLGGKHDKPITADLSEAIRSVHIPESRQRLVDELLNIDEPGVLAHLLVNLPEEYKHSVKRRSWRWSLRMPLSLGH